MKVKTRRGKKPVSALSSPLGTGPGWRWDWVLWLGESRKRLFNCRCFPKSLTLIHFPLMSLFQPSAPSVYLHFQGFLGTFLGLEETALLIQNLWKASGLVQNEPCGDSQLENSALQNLKSGHGRGRGNSLPSGFSPTFPSLSLREVV